MPTTTTTFSFATTAESFVANPASANHSLTYDGATGNPAGALKARVSGKNVTLGTSYWEWTGTWEDLGVPAGTLVTAIQLTQAYTRCTEAVAPRAGGVTVGPYELRDSAGTTVIGTLWAGRSGITAVDGAWVAAGSQTAVSVPSHASDTTVKLRLSDTLGTANTTGAAVSTYDDEVALLITYAPPDPDPYQAWPQFEPRLIRPSAVPLQLLGDQQIPVEPPAEIPTDPDQAWPAVAGMFLAPSLSSLQLRGETSPGATTHTKAGGAAGGAAGSGTRTLVSQRTGGGASSLAGSGAKVVTNPTTYDKTGGGAAGTAASGPKSIQAGGEHVKAGGGACGAAGTGTKAITSPTVHVKAGGGATAVAGSGPKTITTATVHTKTGGGATAVAGTGTKSVQAGGEHLKAGGAAAGVAGTGTKTVTTPTVYAKAGGAAAGLAGTGLALVAHEHVKTGGAALVLAGGGSAVVYTPPPVTRGQMAPVERRVPGMSPVDRTGPTMTSG